MIAPNQMNMPIKPLKTLDTMRIIIKHHIAQMIDNIIRLNNIIPIFDNSLIMLYDIFKTTRFINKISIMTEVNESQK